MLEQREHEPVLVAVERPVRLAGHDRAEVAGRVLQLGEQCGCLRAPPQPPGILGNSTGTTWPWPASCAEAAARAPHRLHTVWANLLDLASYGALPGTHTCEPPS